MGFVARGRSSVGELPLCKRAVIGSNPIASMMLLSAACGAWSTPPDPIAEARQHLHDAEQEVLWVRARREIVEGNGIDAAQAVALGLEVAPDRFAPLLSELRPLVGPETLLPLARRHAPEWVDDLAERARVSAAVARYAEGTGPAATWLAGQAVLQGVRREYHIIPDEAAMLQGARVRVTSALRALDEPVPPGLTAPTANVDGLVTRALAGGLPEPLVVAEAVEGALAALDPHTRPVWADELASWQQHHRGVEVGVGLTLDDAADGTVVVTVPVVGGPAFRAGVRQGAVVLEVDDLVVARVPRPRAAAVAERLAGAPGTSVTITLGPAPGRALELVREAVPVETVSGWRRRSDNRWDPWRDRDAGVAFVRISAFRPDTDDAFDALASDIQPRVVILDLRGNGGGDVMAAANVADRFLADGVVADLTGRTIEPQILGEGEVSWNTALPGHHLETVPVVVLVDRFTASSAELLAGALRERRQAPLVGETTVGKGLSQGLRQAPEHTVAWQVTTGTWTLPSGVALGSGLVPDVPLTLSPAERFVVRRLRTLREHPLAHADGSPMQPLAPAPDPALPPLEVDPQVHAALRVARCLAEGHTACAP